MLSQVLIVIFESKKEGVNRQVFQSTMNKAIKSSSSLLQETIEKLFEDLNKQHEYRESNHVLAYVIDTVRL
jgi:hypothetical protein